VPLGDIQRTHASEIEGIQPGYEYIYTLLPCTQLLNRDEFTKDHKHDNDFIPDFLTDEGPSTG